ncbi:ABC transporter ATP-binding protein [Mannheimia haemolytica]
MSNLLTCQNLSIVHQQKKLLEIQEIAFEQGKFTAIIGPNGAGKTTLLKALSGNNAQTNSAVFYQHQRLTDLNGYALAQNGQCSANRAKLPFP